MKECCIAKAQEIWMSMSLKNDETSKMEKCDVCDFNVNIMVETYDPEM